MVRVLIPVFLLAIVAITVLIIHKRESKVAEIKRLRGDNAAYRGLIKTLDRAAADEYTVTNSPFAGIVLDAIRRSQVKEIV